MQTAKQGAAKVAKGAAAGASEETAKLAKKVVALRDKGVAWWRIAVELGLPGAGELPAGKKGAGNARRLYLTLREELPDPITLPKPSK